MEQTKRLTKKRAILTIFLSIAILVVSQVLALAISGIIIDFGVPGAICNIIASMLYVIFAYIGAKLLCEKFLKISIIDMRIPHIKLICNDLCQVVN